MFLSKKVNQPFEGKFFKSDSAILVNKLSQESECETGQKELRSVEENRPTSMFNCCNLLDFMYILWWVFFWVLLLLMAEKTRD